LCLGLGIVSNVGIRIRVSDSDSDICNYLVAVGKARFVSVGNLKSTMLARSRSRFSRFARLDVLARAFFSLPAVFKREALALLIRFSRSLLSGQGRDHTTLPIMAESNIVTMWHQGRQFLQVLCHLM